MDWLKLKETVYYEDGSLRDILIKNTKEEDWEVWAQFVNENYEVSINNHQTAVEYRQIDSAEIKRLWDDIDSDCITATIYVGNALVNVYFFDPNEIENDITPREILNIDDHDQIMNYMKGISKALNKDVILTPEDTAEEALITVRQDHVIIEI